MLATSRVNRAREPLAEMSIFSAMLAPLNCRVSKPSWPSTMSLPSPGFQTKVSSPRPCCSVVTAAAVNEVVAVAAEQQVDAVAASERVLPVPPSTVRAIRPASPLLAVKVSSPPLALTADSHSCLCPGRMGPG